METTMTSANFKQAQRTALDLFVFESDITDFDVPELVNMLRSADEQYFNESESFLTDEQYDTVKRFVEKIDETNSYFIGVGSATRGGKVALPFQMGSLTQSYEGDVVRWVEKYKLYTEKITISDKLDGVSGLVIYGSGSFQIAYSRGDGSEGADISRHLRKIKTVPKTIPTKIISAVRGEIIISETNFKILCDKGLKSRSGEQYKNSRNAVAGIMNAESNPDWIYDYIDFIAYEVVDPNYWSKDVQFENLKNVGFKTAPAFVVDGGRLTDSNLIDMVNARRLLTDYAIDGIVLEINDADLRRTVNPSKETLNPEYARKYKVASADNTAVTTVIDIELNVSKLGYVKPTIIFEPVDLMGVTISRCTGFNMKFIYENKIQPGTEIRITRSGDVIPFITGVVTPGPLL